MKIFVAPKLSQQENEDDEAKKKEEELDLIETIVNDPDAGKYVVIPNTPPIIPDTPDPNAQGQ